MKDTVIHVDEMPNGDYLLENGTILAAAEFEALQSLQPDTVWIIFIDCASQRKRTNAIIIDFNLAK